MISIDIRKLSLENHTTILVSFTVEVDLWRSTIPVELPGRVQIIISLRWTSLSTMSEHHHSLFTDFTLHVPCLSHDSFCMPQILMERFNLKKFILRDKISSQALKIWEIECMQDSHWAMLKELQLPHLPFTFFLLTYLHCLLQMK